MNVDMKYMGVQREDAGILTGMKINFASNNKCDTG